MKPPFKNHDRRVVPRWRSIDESVALSEADPLVLNFQGESEPSQTLALRRAEFEADPGQGMAGDLLSVAITEGQTEGVRDVAKGIVEAGGPLPGLLREIALSAIGKKRAGLLLDASTESGKPEDALINRGQFIRRAREHLAQHANSPFLWLELARQHTIMGDRKKAERELSVSRALAPNNRIVLRATARFLLHEGEEDQAAWLLSKTPNVRRDPWLLSAEIAVAQVSGRTSKNISAGTSMLSRSEASVQTTELAAALATVELENGDIKAARRLFGRSLENPNENSFSQAVWAHHSEGVAGIDLSGARYLEENFEGPATGAYFTGDWRNALRWAHKWQEQEPFSSRPATLGSFIASVLLSEPATAEEMLRIAIRAKPDDAVLLNNLAFILASSDRITQAEKLLARARDSNEFEEAEVAVLATEGLIRFRQGAAEEGSDGYRKAIELAASQGERLAASMAVVMLIREMERIRLAGVDDLRNQLERAASRMNQHERRVLAAMMSSCLGDAAGASS